MQALWASQVTLPAAVTSVRATRTFIEEQLTQHAMLYLINDMRLVGSELATNATRHARTPFTVRLEGAEEQVRLSVSDGSPRPPVQRQPTLDEPGGRGLQVVDAYALDWGVAAAGRGSKSVWAAFGVRVPQVV